MDNVDPVFALDAVAGALFVLLLLEGVRRAVGWILVAVLAARCSWTWPRAWSARRAADRRRSRSWVRA
jgi:TRAP-type uncharacterized transport system fused permease subunit